MMEIELPPEVMVHLMDEMSNTEERLAHGGSERLQLGSLVGAFATARWKKVLLVAASLAPAAGALAALDGKKTLFGTGRLRQRRLYALANHLPLRSMLAYRREHSVKRFVPVFVRADAYYMLVQNCCASRMSYHRRGERFDCLGLRLL